MIERSDYTVDYRDLITKCGTIRAPECHAMKPMGWSRPNQWREAEVPPSSGRKADQ
jgi:hypothetical protein